ncbi:MAG: hypothetical protein KKB50_10715 [Planctomycetes bacterium]|nr:hypothetical protein [Planctomycetota bacterium]
MAANVYMKSFTLGLPQWAKLSAIPLVIDATIIASSKNPNPINLRVVGGITTSWQPGATVWLPGVDLARIEINGPTGNAALVVGMAPRTKRRAAPQTFMFAQAEPEQGEPVEPEPGGGTK